MGGERYSLRLQRASALSGRRAAGAGGWRVDGCGAGEYGLCRQIGTEVCGREEISTNNGVGWSVCVMEEIDLLVNIAGEDAKQLERHGLLFLESLMSKCSLEKVNVFLVLRECMPIVGQLKKIIDGYTAFK